MLTLFSLHPLGRSLVIRQLIVGVVFHAILPSSQHHHNFGHASSGGVLDFHCCLGFCAASSLDLPGHTMPHPSFSWAFSLGPWNMAFPNNWVQPGIIQSVALLASLDLGSAMPLQPTGTEELRRADRRFGRQLQADRVILQQTRSRREILLAEFDPGGIDRGKSC